jgi:hypothetical protein
MAEEDKTIIEENQQPSSEGENPGESIPGAPQENPEGGQPQSAEEPGFRLESFNKTFETSFEDEGSLKNALERVQKFDQVQLDLQQAQEKASKYDQIIQFYEPKNLYGDEETYAFVELKKKFPDKDLGIVSKVRSQEFDQMSDLDKLVLADKLKVKMNVSDQVRKEGILQKLGIESGDQSEWTDTDRYKIASELSNNIGVLQEIKNFKPEAKTFDLAAEKENYEIQQAERKKSLEKKIKPFAESLLSNYNGPKAYQQDKDGKYVEIFSFELNKSMKSDFADSLVNVMVDAGMEPTQENLQKAQKYMDNHFKVMNYDKAIAAAIKHGQAIADEKAHNEMHSNNPVNTKEAPKISEEKGLTLKERVRKEWGQKK